MNFGTVAILGPGLIGGSLALALTERQLTNRLVLYSRSEKPFAAIRDKLPEAHCFLEPRAAVRDADVIVLCVPIEKMKELVEEICDVVKPTALVTDVGSAKASVDRELGPLLEGRALWIGSHPMAGSEQSGFSAARADLFQDAAVIVTPTEKTTPAALDGATAFWRSVGGRTFELDPEDHDLAIAEISHVPHLVAAILAAKVNQASLPLAGGGFRDTTRIAAGSPELWTEILWANRVALMNHCDSWSQTMKSIAGFFQDGGPQAKSELFDLLRKAQTVRSSLASKPLP